MYKTAMRVMMVGLVAMLGAEAEAHWVVIKGRCLWHSGECVRQDKDTDETDLVPIPDPIPTDTVGELVSKVQRVEVLCPGNPIGQTVDGKWTLTSGKKPIVQSDITTVTIGSVTRRNAEWSAVVSDGYFLADVDDDAFCPDQNGTPVKPLDVLIRLMAVDMNLYLGSSLHSTWRATTCTLSNKYNFINYPKNLPPRGARFECSGISTCQALKCPLPQL